jgi:recombinational DNA repair protein (RecF pathway)
MAYHIYYTDSFILGRYTAGEWDSRVVLLTRELGLVTVLVKGYRRPASKLRAHLSLFAHTHVGLVRGKETWRLIFAESTGLVETVVRDRPRRLVVGKVLAVVRRLVKGEYPNPEVFDEVLRVIQNLVKVLPSTHESLDRIELIGVLRVLHHLGYVPDLPELRAFVGNEDVSLDSEILSVATRRVIVETINSSLQATHL